MARQIQLRRGTTTQNNNFTGAEGEVTYDTESKQLRYHDATTQGGLKVPKDIDVVHKSEDEIIAGNKTFEQAITIKRATGQRLIVRKDVNNLDIGSLESVDNGNNNSTEIFTFSEDGTQNAILGLTYGNGTPYAYAPTPNDTTSTSSNKIATTGWVNSRLQEYIPSEGVADANLSNLSATGKNISNWSSNVTNCITEIPQDIKLELNNGTLTLKAGSKVYVPNGAGVFDVRNITTDKTYSITSNGEFLIFVTQNSSMWGFDISFCGSGTTPPERGLFYNTNNNSINSYYNGAVETSGYSFPIAKVTVSNSTISNIDQVFNGFGYIGSTVFVLPGVKGLMPDGRNEDGTLKSQEITIENVNAVTPTVLHNLDVAIILENNIDHKISYNGAYRYDENQNRTFDDSPSWLSERQSCYVGSCTLTDSVISNFKINTSFHAVNYNEFNEHRIIDFMKPTATNNYTWYRKWSDGWVEQGGYTSGGSSSTVTFPVAMADTHYCLTLGNTSNRYEQIRIIGRTVTTFTIANADSGGTVSGFWQISGMAA